MALKPGSPPPRGPWAPALAPAPRPPLSAVATPSLTYGPRVASPRPSARPPLRILTGYELRSAPVQLPGVGAYIVALLLILAMTAAILAGGWIQGAEATLLVAVVAVLEAVLLARAGIGRIGATLLALPLCAAVVVPITIGLLPVSVSKLGWYHAVGEYIIQALAGLLATGSGDFVNWAFKVGLATVVWASGYWLGWVAFRERRGILAVLPVVVILAVNSLNAPSLTSTSGAGSPVGIAETLALFGVLLLIGIAELGGLAAGWRWRRVPAMEGLRERFIVSLSLAGILVVVVSLLLPPLSSADIFNVFSGLGGKGSGAGAGAGGPAPIGFSQDVVPGGALTNLHQPVLSYYTDQGGGTYLAAVADNIFTNGNWLPGFEGQEDEIPYVAGSTIPEDPSVHAAATSTVTVHITYAAPATGRSNLALFPGEPSSADHGGTVSGQTLQEALVGGSIVSGSSSPPSQSGSAIGLVDLDQLALGGGLTSLTTAGLASDATVAQLEQAGTDYPAWLREEFASPLVPSNAGNPERVQAQEIARLADQWVAGVPHDPYDEATAIESNLRGASFSYTITPPQPPSGEWPVTYFLTSSHQGYCQYFADAMGAMLRSLGIPARLVSGYGPGSSSAGAVTRSGQHIFQVTSTDAHVWVEAYFPSYGWIAFEPTPATSQFGVYLPIPRGGSTPPPATATGPETAPHNRTPRPSAGATSGGGGGHAGGPPAWPLAFPGVVLLLGVFGILATRWWRRPRALSGAWRRLALAGRLVGVRRVPSETRAGFTTRLSAALGGAGPPLLAAELATVAAVTGKAEFAARGLEPSDLALWSGAWSVIARRLARLLRRRLLRRPPAV